MTFNDSPEEILKALENGEFPKGYRLFSGVNEDEGRVKEFRKVMVCQFFDPRNREAEYQFIDELSSPSRKRLIEYLVNDEVDIRQLPDEIPQPLRNHLYALRGALACAVLEHCLSLRCGVTYGVPDDERKKEKRVAVPYEAADVPSKKNEYSQPDVSIMLSFLAYYNEGLTAEEFEEALRKLKSLNMSTQINIF